MAPSVNITAEAVDPVFYFILGISVIILIGIAIALIYFAIRYNRKRCPVPEEMKEDILWLELAWTIIPTIIVLAMFWYGWEGYLSLRRVPEDAMEVQGSARKWSWLFTYENGKTSKKLYVPVGKPVKVRLTSEDVIHSFFAPAFRVKRDCVPGMETYVWFVADEASSYNVFCAEYCGLGHSKMVTTIEAVTEEEFEEWLQPKPKRKVVHPPGLAHPEEVHPDHLLPDEKQPDYLQHEEEHPDYLQPEEEQPDYLQLEEEHPGLALLEKYLCTGCHSLDGSEQIGPTLKGIFNRQVTVKKEGQEITLTSDRDYLLRSIREPEAEIVIGFEDFTMLTVELSDEEIDAIIDFLQKL